MVPSLLKVIPLIAGSCEATLSGLPSTVAASTEVKLVPSATTKVASSLTTPVSSCATGAVFVTVIVKVPSSVVEPSETL